jgi:transcriptional regulator with XRE-family HTH domain
MSVDNTDTVGVSLPQPTPRSTGVIIARIQARIAALRLSASEVSRRAGRDPSVVHDILAGRNKNPTVGLLHDLAHGLDCDVSYLLGRRLKPSHCDLLVSNWQAASDAERIEFARRVGVDVLFDKAIAPAIR